MPITTPTDELEQARQAEAAAHDEAQAAERAAADLAERLQSGDDSVKPRDLTTARELVAYWRERLVSFRRKRESAEANARTAQLDQLAEGALDALGQLGPVAKAYDDARTALGTLRAALSGYEEQRGAVLGRARALGQTEPGGRVLAGQRWDSDALTVDGRALPQVEFEAVLRELQLGGDGIRSQLG